VIALDKISFTANSWRFTTVKQGFITDIRKFYYRNCVQALDETTFISVSNKKLCSNPQWKHYLLWFNPKTVFKPLMKPLFTLIQSQNCVQALDESTFYSVSNKKLRSSSWWKHFLLRFKQKTAFKPSVKALFTLIQSQNCVQALDESTFYSDSIPKLCSSPWWKHFLLWFNPKTVFKPLMKPLLFQFQTKNCVQALNETTFYSVSNKKLCSSPRWKHFSLSFKQKTAFKPLMKPLLSQFQTKNYVQALDETTFISVSNKKLCSSPWWNHFYFSFKQKTVFKPLMKPLLSQFQTKNCVQALGESTFYLVSNKKLCSSPRWKHFLLWFNPKTAFKLLMKTVFLLIQPNFCVQANTFSSISSKFYISCNIFKNCKKYCNQFLTYV
jgi:hypothetical protein